MKYLIVTADDLGLCRSINEGIAKAFDEGIATAVSLVPAADAFDDAVKVLKGLPVKSVGAHLALTEVKPLLSSSAYHKDHNSFFFSSVFSGLKTDDIYKELKAQIDMIRSKGLKVTHINSHEHIHLIPRVLDIFIRLAKEYEIPVIRFPRGDRRPSPVSLKENYRSFLLEHFSGKIKKVLDDSGIRYTDFFAGLLDAGRLDIKGLKGIIEGLDDGVTELVTHPGFLSPEVLDRYSWHRGAEKELFALTDRRIKKAIRYNNVRLISFDDFLALKK